jgi:hypothetical protein
LEGVVWRKTEQQGRDPKVTYINQELSMLIFENVLN